MFDLPRFVDRDHAGRRLGEVLRRYARDASPLVLALPRGGVPVGARIAEALNAPLEDRSFPNLAGRTVIVVDDGAATGASMRAAVVALRQLRPRKLVVALPVASREAARSLTAVADDCVCLPEPEPFYSVGAWYDDFSQLSDAEVRTLIANSERREGSGTDLAHVRHAP